jgi:hypothetical protein
MAQKVAELRLDRLGDERERTQEKLNDLLALAEEEQRDLHDYENEQATKYRSRIGDIEEEIIVLASDIERNANALDVSRVVRERQENGPQQTNGGPVVYRHFAEFARDQLIMHDKFGKQVLTMIGENPGSPVEMRVVEPAIGGWEVGLIGAFNAVVFDANRFFHLGTHL